jgi:hypothetical protein
MRSVSRLRVRLVPRRRWVEGWRSELRRRDWRASRWRWRLPATAIRGPHRAALKLEGRLKRLRCSGRSSKRWKAC